MSVATRAELYHTLAEVLADPPNWMAEVGHHWPLVAAAQDVVRLENHSTLSDAIEPLSSIPSESLDQRRERFDSLFFDIAKPPVAMHESMACDGHLAGPSMLAVDTVYKAAGLTTIGSELPDHAAVELSFLAYLCEQEMANAAQATQWRQVRRLFIRRHAGRWLPMLGQALANTGDPVYGPIGQLLSVVLPEKKSARSRTQSSSRPVPVLPSGDLACTLCGFCVQVCPTRALTIHETDQTTALVLSPAACISCSKCVRTCMTNALNLKGAAVTAADRVLYESPRAQCPVCGAPTVSEAELVAIAAQIGTPDWLDYCLECRSRI